MTFHLINELQEEQLELLSEENDETVDEIINQAIDEYYMRHHSLNTKEGIEKFNHKRITYLRSIAILKDNYESVKEVNDSINDFMNN